MKFPQPSFKAAVLWLLLSTVLLCLPGSALPQHTWFDKIWLDKWVHLFLFAIMVVLWCYPYASISDRQRQQRIFLMITFLTIIYAILMEFVQLNFIPFRSFDILDIIAGAAGSFIGLLLVSGYLKK